MPTITQLSAAADVTPADAIPVSQDGTTRSVSIGTLLASMQPAIIAESGTLLGRTSLGPGGPEPVTIGAGLLLNAGTLAANGFDPSALPQQPTLVPSDWVMLDSGGVLTRLPLSALRGLFAAGANVSIDAAGTISASGEGGGSDPFAINGLPPAAAAAATDLLAISQGGTERAISCASLLDGLTIDLAQPALPVTDADTFWVAQGASTMLRQSFAALWAWLATKQPSYRPPVLEITADTTLDGIVHNGRLLICSQAVTLLPAAPNMGNGFFCEVLNLSGGDVTFGLGIITSSGTATLPSGQSATIRVAIYSGGTVVFATFAGGSGGGTPVEPPGQVIGLTASDATSASILLNWSVPASGGSVAGYTVQYRITGNTTWSSFASGITGTTVTVTGLAAATAYEFKVHAMNGGGAGPSSPTVGGSTTAVPGNVTAVNWLMVPVGPYVHGSGAIGLNAQITPADAAVQFGFSTSATVPPSLWVEATHVNTDLWGAYLATPAVPGTWYAWVEGTDGSRPTVHATPFTVT